MSDRKRTLFLSVALVVSACAGRHLAPTIIAPAVTTAVVTDDPDDPAIWIHSSDPAQSIVVGTNKVARPAGSLVVFDLQGQILQTIADLDRPNNVDIEQNVLLDGVALDIAVVSERYAHAVRVYSIDRQTRRLSEIARLPVFAGEAGEFAEPMGIGIYKRKDDAVFIVVGRKTGPVEGYLWQYRLHAQSLELVRKFGQYSGAGEIEAIVIDDALGYVYYADERKGIRKYHADPDAANSGTELALFGRKGYRGDREGLAIYATDQSTGYLVSTDQINGGSRYLLYRREGTPDDIHNHQDVVGILKGPADGTDGIEVTSMPLTSTWPRGLLVAMNSGKKNFLYFPWPHD